MKKLASVKWVITLKNEWKGLLASFFIPALLSLLISLCLPKEYRSSAQILVPEVAAGGTFIQTALGAISSGGSSVPISTQAMTTILKSNLVIDRVIEKFNLTSKFKLKNSKAARDYFKERMYSVETLENEGIIKITVSSRFNDLNPEIANYVVPLIDTANLILKITHERNFIKVLQLAEPATKKFSPRYKLNTLIGGMLGVFLFLVYLYFKGNLSLSDE
ncbi:hypothetical protein KAW48_05400 [candidate division WOR-3 bacterium]|nr:hypothetical protein [candidate division WOR-3 bacterium]